VKITRRNFLKSMGAIGGATALGGILPPPSFAQTKEPIRLGFIQPLTGPFGTEASDQVAAATLAVEEFQCQRRSSGAEGRTAGPG